MEFTQEQLNEAVQTALQRVFQPVAELQVLNEKKALTTAEAARLYNIGKNTLEQMRMNGHGPDYSQPVKGGSVLYTHAAMKAWLERIRIPVSET